MAKPEWGTKRVCQSCGARFYDLHRSPIECPKCGTVFDPEIVTKSRRPRAAVAAPVVAEALPASEPELVEEEEAVGDLGESEEEEVIEDASELGEDEDDVAEVIENAEEEEGER
ncbi:MAG TPA: TIGR02300 family protein [Alphaproteobacteria bacterium]|nr:TIGR02300 family protein [Alphaproteobacteria bacterium]